MNYDKNGKSSHVFYILLVILCALIILNIVERNILEDIENNKEGFNVLYYDMILNNIKLAKVVLCILLFTIFIILVNPLKLFSVITINIFSIIGEQYPHLMPSDNSNDYINNLIGQYSHTKYIKDKKNLWAFDKTLKEWIMNLNKEEIINRIREDTGINDEDLVNLIQSIRLENKLSNLDYDQFNKMINALKIKLLN